MRFTDTYHQMTAGNKWILSTGRAVEDVIYLAAKHLPNETIAHSFILNPDDSWFVDLFDFEEWTEILAYREDRREMLRAVRTPESLDRIPDSVCVFFCCHMNLYSNFKN